MRSATLAVLVLAIGFAGTVQAQKVYKCTDARGHTAFQQIPCEREADTVSVRTYKAPPAPPPRAQGSFELQEQAPRQTYFRRQPQPAKPEQRRPDLNPMSNDAEAQRRLEIMASTREGRAMLRAMSEQRLPRPAAPNPNDGIGQPTRVIDPRTSMPVEGAIKVAPNRIWDPKTGKYYWTTP